MPKAVIKPTVIGGAYLDDPSEVADATEHKVGAELADGISNIHYLKR